MPHIPLQPIPHLSAFRRISLGTWRTARDPTVYGSVTLRMDAALAWIAAAQAASGVRITLTHLMAKAVAEMLHAYPEANALQRWGTLYQRGDNVVVFQVAMADPHTGKVDLSAHASRDGHTKSVFEIAQEFGASTQRIRAAKDPELERTRGLMKRMPGWLVGKVLDLLSFGMYTLNLDLSFLGLPRNPFGPVWVTNVGSLGIEEAYVPLVPYSRSPLLIAMGAVSPSPVVDETGEIVVAQTMKLMATFDHRVLDGAHASHMIRIVRGWMEEPTAHFGDPAAFVPDTSLTEPAESPPLSSR